MMHKSEFRMFACEHTMPNRYRPGSSDWHFLFKNNCIISHVTIFIMFLCVISFLLCQFFKVQTLRGFLFLLLEERD